MRKLLITRGPQGAGKSTTIKQLGLENYTVSPDKTRLFLTGGYLTEYDKIRIPQHRMDAWKLTIDQLKNRMNSMETIAYDATLPLKKEVDDILKIAAENRYDVRILDFYDTPLEKALEQNNTREEFTYVPENVIKNIYENYQKIDDRRIIFSRENYQEQIQDFLHVKKRDLSSYNEIVFIGDLQGCLQPIKNSNSPLADGLKKDNYYIFVGDYFDRGLENAEVAKWLIENVVRKENVLLLRGNHELHLEKMVDGLEPVSAEFKEKTFPQFEKAGLKKEYFKELVESCVEVAPIHWRGNDILVTHGGISGWPKNLHLVPGEQFESGTGSYEQPVDLVFSKWAEKEKENNPNSHLLQIHGHRNAQYLPILSTPHSINLEGQVEFGGHLRMVVLNKDGLQPIEIRNTYHLSRAERVAETLAKGHRMHGPNLPIPEWHKRGEIGQTHLSKETLDILKKHEMINERVSNVLSHVSAFNFTHEAFQEGKWDAVSLSARGLFVNTEDGTIIARGYEKFFNVNEKPETQIHALKESLKFPIVGYNKHNGFLGITGYDKKTDTLIIASKSMLDSDFAKLFKDILGEKLGPAGIEKLYRLNKDLEVSCVFEVIDIEKDPHIIRYQENQIILLDAVRRSEKFEKLPYNELEKIGNFLNCPIKEQAFKIDNAIGFEQKVKSIEKQDFLFNKKPTEGFVIEDSRGDMVKVKSGYYNTWKRMRGMRDRMIKSRMDSRPFNTARYDENAEVQGFVAFCERQPTDALLGSIMDLRDAYLENKNQILPGIDRAPNKEAEMRKNLLDGFEKGVQSVQKQLKNGTAKEETVEKILNNAKEDEEKIQILQKYPEFAKLLENKQIYTR